MLKSAFLIAPSFYCESEYLDLARDFLKRLGLKPKHSLDILSRFGCYAGDFKRRVMEIDSAYKDKDSKYIFSINGGAGAVQVIDFLDYQEIKKSGKVLIGFSDVTILLNSIYKKTNARCIHGPNLNKKFDKFHKKTILSLIDALNKKNYKIKFLKKDVLCEGVSKSEIVGGNLNLIERSLSTDFEIDTRGKIIFLEDVRIKEGYILDMLWQLKLAGKFEDIKGVILGSFEDCGDNVGFYLREFFKNFKCPVILNQPIGHVEPNISIPLGETCILDTEKQFWEINFKTDNSQQI